MHTVLVLRSQWAASAWNIFASSSINVLPEMLDPIRDARARTVDMSFAIHLNGIRRSYVDHDGLAHSWKARINSMLLTGSGAAQRRERQRRRAAGAIHLNAMSFAIHLNAMRRAWRCNPLECDRRSWRCIVGQSLTNYVESWLG